MRVHGTLLLTALAVAAVALSACRQPAEGIEPPKILSFELRAAENTALDSDIVGLIDEERKLIEIALPDSLTAAERASMNASVGLGQSAVLVGGSLRDFTQSPLSFSVTNEQGDAATYLVNVVKAYPEADPDALIFSEYYAGSAYTLKGSNNQYLELTNLSSSELDLGGYSLHRSVWENGIRRSDKDANVR